MKCLPFLLLAVSVSAIGLENSNWQFAYTPFNAQYVIYGGELGDTVAPSANDRKISISFGGVAAKKVFDEIGPDIKDACGTEQGGRIRMRDKGNVTCSYSKSSGYYCSFGFDLNSGKSIGGSIC